MLYPNLSQIFKVMSWHQNQRDKKPGESVGIFLPIPNEISKLIPTDRKEKEDNSPNHITVFYIGQYNIDFKDKLSDVVSNVCSQFKPFKVKLGTKVRKFNNDKDQQIIHFPVFSNKLKKVYNTFDDELRRNLIKVQHKYPEFKPHVTLEYVNRGEKPKYRDFQLEGTSEFVCENLWIWGLDEPLMFVIGKK